MIRLKEDGLHYLQSWEKFMNRIYDDGYGFDTIYYGHRCLPGEKYLYTIEDGLRYLARDIEIAENAAAKLINVATNHTQYIALISMVFNTGIERFKNSQTRKLINSGADKETVAKRIETAFITANGKISNGLKARRKADANLWRT